MSKEDAIIRCETYLKLPESPRVIARHNLRYLPNIIGSYPKLLQDLETQYSEKPEFVTLFIMTKMPLIFAAYPNHKVVLAPTDQISFTMANKLIPPNMKHKVPYITKHSDSDFETLNRLDPLRLQFFGPHKISPEDYLSFVTMGKIQREDTLVNLAALT